MYKNVLLIILGLHRSKIISRILFLDSFNWSHFFRKNPEKKFSLCVSSEGWGDNDVISWWKLEPGIIFFRSDILNIINKLP